MIDSSIYLDILVLEFVIGVNRLYIVRTRNNYSTAVTVSPNTAAFNAFRCNVASNGIQTVSIVRY